MAKTAKTETRQIEETARTNPKIGGGSGPGTEGSPKIGGGSGPEAGGVAPSGGNDPRAAATERGDALVIQWLPVVRRSL